MAERGDDSVSRIWEQAQQMLGDGGQPAVVLLLALSEAAATDDELCAVGAGSWE